MSESKPSVTTKYDVGDGRKMTVTEIVEVTTISRQAVQKRINNGTRGAELLEPPQDRGRERKLETPISGWTDEQLYWLRQGRASNGGVHESKTPPLFEDDGRIISFTPKRTEFYSSTGKDVES